MIKGNGQAANREVIVKFMAKGHRSDDHEAWIRQFPHREPVWGQCRFVFDQSANEYDWLAVYDDLAPVGTERFSTRCERLPCPSENTIFITAEPSSVKIYGSEFLAQFGAVLTGQEAEVIRHPGLIHSQPALRWFYGLPFGTSVRASYDYDRMAAATPPQKTGQVSTVCSNKQMAHTLHQKRFEFTRRLKAAMPELDQFGQGVRPIDDKAEALDPYRYHIAIENHISPHHWTEKLADAFLGYTLPLYYGCPNVSDYFPEESFVAIDIDDFEGTLALIRTLVEENAYDKRLSAIIEARRRVLEEYNIFAVLSREIERMESAENRQRLGSSSRVIYGRHGFRKHHPLRGVLDLLESWRHKSR